MANHANHALQAERRAALNKCNVAMADAAAVMMDVERRPGFQENPRNAAMAAAAAVMMDWLTVIHRHAVEIKDKGEHE